LLFFSYEVQYQATVVYPTWLTEDIEKPMAKQQIRLVLQKAIENTLKVF